MYFFIDESWQTSADRKFKVGVLAAIPIQISKFNDFMNEVNRLKRYHLGPLHGDTEIKGKDVFKKYHFRSELKGEPSYYLELARDLFRHIENNKIPLFASVAFEEDEVDLACARPRQLDRPFFFLFERINQLMKENFPASNATLVFDDRDVVTNKNISKAITNFLSKSSVGRNFGNISRAPYFAISSENVGIQMADLVAHIIGRRFSGDRGFIKEFFQKVKSNAYKSQPISIKQGTESKMGNLHGIKIAKKRTVGLIKIEAGVLDSQA